MIKRMRMKIIAIAMAALIILLGAILITTNLYMSEVAHRDIDIYIVKVLSRDGIQDNFREFDADERQTIADDLHLPPPNGDGFISGFAVRVIADQIEILYDEEELSDESITEYVANAINDKGKNGNIGDYRYGMKESDNGKIIVFANTTFQNKLLTELLRLSIIIGLISTSVLLVLIIILARFITRPVEVAMEKQKRFIADSSHELKTPLSIISANLEMLEMETSSNKRISAMTSGVNRMKYLIKELLLLARTEEKTTAFQSFNMSELVESTILPLEVIAYEAGNTIETFIDEDVTFKGDEEGIRKVVGALMENAIKYSRENTVIKAKLSSKGDSKILEVYNEGIGVTKEQKERLFDKFYRVDVSRNSETGGHGLGLSIVKNIVDLHKGKIYVESIPNEYISFKITLHG